jgi:hypothetical protein
MSLLKQILKLQQEHLAVAKVVERHRQWEQTYGSSKDHFIMSPPPNIPNYLHPTDEDSEEEEEQGNNHILMRLIHEKMQRERNDEMHRRKTKLDEAYMQMEEKSRRMYSKYCKSRQQVWRRKFLRKKPKTYEEFLSKYWNNWGDAKNIS